MWANYLLGPVEPGKGPIWTAENDEFSPRWGDGSESALRLRVDQGNPSSPYAVVQWRHRDHPFLPRIDVVRPERIPRESIVTLDGVFGIRRPGGRIVMDKVQPAEPWRPGFDNIFDWPTRDVIHQLGKINMYDLGVVARLGNTDPSVAERVAPVIFYHSQVPANVLGYVFTFKTNGHARLTCEVYDEASVKPVFTHHIHRQPGGTAFTVRWDSSQAAEGSYRLVVRGFFLENNRRINQTVSFYHQPAVR